MALGPRPGARAPNGRLATTHGCDSLCTCSCNVPHAIDQSKQSADSPQLQLQLKLLLELQLKFSLTLVLCDQFGQCPSESEVDWILDRVELRLKPVSTLRLSLSLSPSLCAYYLFIAFLFWAAFSFMSQGCGKCGKCSCLLVASYLLPQPCYLFPVTCSTLTCAPKRFSQSRANVRDKL